MRIGLHDVDSKELPNLALLKLAAWHRGRGDEVEVYAPLLRDRYDKVYASKMFDFSPAPYVDPERMEVGGTGWDVASRLPPEVERARVMPEDYALFGYGNSLGFTSRGCRMRCPFCVVPRKEGRPEHADTVSAIWTNRGSRFVVLLDNDFFGGPHWEARIAEILDLDLTVNFNQGINVRLITDEQARALASVRFTNLHGTKNQVFFAWDRPRDEELVLAGIGRCVEAGIKPYRMLFAVLVGFGSTPEEDMHRVRMLSEVGCDPFVMPVDKDDAYQRAFARWVNHKGIFKSVPWEDYREATKSPEPVPGGQGELFA